VHFSPTRNAVIVSMGNGGNCGTAWSNTRQAIVSRDQPLYNATRHIPRPSFKQEAAAAQMEQAQLRRDILELEPFLRKHASRFTQGDLAQFNEKLTMYGVEPIVAEHAAAQ
jgi:hypothetical protein